MGLFKRFTDKKKPTVEELNGFKLRLKVGDDPNVYWQKQKEYWEKYKFNKETAKELLCKLYGVTEVSKRDCYSSLEVWIYTSIGPCSKSPIKEHVYVYHYGDKNPEKGKVPVCLACGKELKL